MARRQIIVVGGGTSGAVVAQSLANSTEHEIVVVEPGVLSSHDDTSNFFDVLSDFSLQKIHEVSLTDNATKIPYVQATAIGGGSAINAMLLTGETPDYVRGLVRQATEKEVGPVGKSLLAVGGRLSTLWWNNGRWNPGRALNHLEEEGRIRIVSDDVENLVVQNGVCTGIETRTSSISADVVVMCAGALVTPQILLQSGLGHHNNQIGQGLQDHPTITFALQHSTYQKNFFDAAVVLDGVTSRGDQYLIIGYERASHVEEQIGLVSVMLLTPKSRGSISLHEDGPHIQMNLLSHPDDVLAMREAVRDLMSVLSSTSFSLNFSDVYVDDEGLSVSALATYGDRELDTWIVGQLRPVSHASSSCARAVTSSGLLRGVEGIYIADASILEKVPASTPAGPVTMEARRIAVEIEGGLL